MYRYIDIHGYNISEGKYISDNALVVKGWSLQYYVFFYVYNIVHIL